MSSPLSQEIAKLASEARSRRIHERQIISELTMIVGYAYLAESQSHYWNALRKHLQVFSDLACEQYPVLCEYSLKILHTVGETDLKERGLN